MYLKLTGSLLSVELSCCDCVEIKISRGNVPFPHALGLEPMSRISVTLIAQYVNVCQRKLGTVIMQTVYILQHDSVDTGSLPMEDFKAQSKLLSKYPSPAEVPLYHRTNGGGRLYGPPITVKFYAPPFLSISYVWKDAVMVRFSG
jgi:hypothetical protein